MWKTESVRSAAAVRHIVGANVTSDVQTLIAGAVAGILIFLLGYAFGWRSRGRIR